MANIFYMTGFEGNSGELEKDNGVLGGVKEGLVFAGSASAPSYQTSIVKTGTRAIRCDPTSGNSEYMQYQTNVSSHRPWVHFALRIVTMPASVDRFFLGTPGIGLNAKLRTDGKIELFDTTTSIGVSNTALTTGVWYWIGWRTTAGTSEVFIQIDGQNEIIATSSQNASSVNIGWPNNDSGAVDCVIDDFVVDDSGFITETKVVELVPISDNARDTLWTGGAGGTTNLFDAVDNQPPAGHSTETNTTQIEHAGGAAGTTDRYDANMTTYSTAGISSGDTILALLYLISSGEDVATGTKLLNFSLVSNPSAASGIANFNAGDNAGALGIYPSNWDRVYNTIVQNPSVTLGNSPVMRVVRPETASRVASVCYMAIRVAYQVAPAVQVDLPRRRMTQYLPH